MLGSVLGLPYLGQLPQGSGLGLGDLNESDGIISSLSKAS